jgi:hypothetical protein
VVTRDVGGLPWTIISKRPDKFQYRSPNDPPGRYTEAERGYFSSRRRTSRRFPERRRLPESKSLTWRQNPRVTGHQALAYWLPVVRGIMSLSVRTRRARHYE